MANMENTLVEGNTSLKEFQDFLGALVNGSSCEPLSKIPSSNKESATKGSVMTITSIHLTPLTDTALLDIETDDGKHVPPLS